VHCICFIHLKNNNWVTVRDKCPQINVKKFFFRTDGQTNGQTDKRTHERTDGRSDFIMPQIVFGGIKWNLRVIHV